MLHPWKSTVQVGQGFEQPGLLEHVSVYCRDVGLDDL